MTWADKRDAVICIFITGMVILAMFHIMDKHNKKGE
jgi:hypothetical protein